MLDASRVFPLFNKQFAKTVTHQIQCAVFSIDIVIYDWRTYPTSYGPNVTRFNRAIFDAVERGVKVRCVLNSGSNAARLKILGCQVAVSPEAKIIHSKLMIIDQNIVICGSHNYSESAFTSNEELSYMLIYETKAPEVNEYFERLFSVFSR